MITAYRVWAISNDGSLWPFSSITIWKMDGRSIALDRDCWQPGVNEAEHRHSDDRDHSLDTCPFCGFHGFKSSSCSFLETVRWSLTQTDEDAISAAVVGSVGLWGKIIEHELGYRSQYAMVLSLEDSPLLHDQIVEASRRYDVPVTTS